MTCEIVLKSTSDIKNLNDAAFGYDGKITVSSGRFYIDARSILSLFALVGKKVNLVFPDHERPEKINKLLKKIDYLF